MENPVREAREAQGEREAKEASSWLQGTLVDIGFSVFVLLLSVALVITFGNAMLGSVIGILGALAAWAIVNEIRFHRRRDPRSSHNDREAGL